MRKRTLNRMLSTALSFMFLFAMMEMSTSATYITDAEENGQDAIIVIDPLQGEDMELAAQEDALDSVPLETEEACSTEDGITPYALNCALRSVYAYPMVLRKETGSYIYRTSIRAYSIFNNVQSGSTKVSPAKAVELNNAVLAYYEGLNDGYTYSLAGWYVETTYQLAASGTIKHTPTSPSSVPCFQGTEEVTARVTSGQSFTVAYGFAVDPAMTTYAYMGMSGGYYHANGTSLLLGGGLALNSSLA